MYKGSHSPIIDLTRVRKVPHLPCAELIHGHLARCQHAEPCSAPSLAHRLVLVVLEEADVLERSLRLAEEVGFL